MNDSSDRSERESTEERLMMTVVALESAYVVRGSELTGPLGRLCVSVWLAFTVVVVVTKCAIRWKTDRAIGGSLQSATRWDIMTSLATSCRQ